MIKASAQIVDIQVPHSTGELIGQGGPLLTYDPEWLAITRAFHQYFTTTRQQATYPDEPTARARVSAELEWVEENIVRKATNDGAKSPLSVDSCQMFAQTAPGPGSEGNAKLQQRKLMNNDDTSYILTLSQHRGIPIHRLLHFLVCSALTTRSTHRQAPSTVIGVVVPFRLRNSILRFPRLREVQYLIHFETRMRDVLVCRGRRAGCPKVRCDTTTST